MDATGDAAFARRAVGLLVARLAAILIVTLATWVILRAALGTDAFPPGTLWATLGLFPVNVYCLWLLRRLYRERGLTLREALGIQPGRLGRDIAWGLLWLVVLNVPFMLAVVGTVFALYGAGAPEAFATIFIDPDAATALSPVVLLVLGVVSAVPFMLINAPTEELVFRGYGLQGLAARWGAPAAIPVTSLLFGVQHMFFAATPPGMLVYVVAFTVWGLVAALIVRRQGRLFPVVVAHWIINIVMSAPAIVFPILQLTGVLET